MLRSKRYVFVSFCLMAQGLRAQGLVRDFPAIVKPIIELLMKYDYNIWQMPCPELLFDSFYRRPCGKKQYNTPQNRKKYRQVADYMAKMCMKIEQVGSTVDFILGVERSPSCAISKLTAPGRGGYPRIVSGQGIFTEELINTFQCCQHRPKFVGVDTLHIEETIRVLRQFMEECHG